jgi:putative ABC transport system permease protein
MAGIPLRQIARRVLRRPGLAVTAVLTLGLAIGANTAIFSVLDAVALHPLPYPQADRLVRIGVVIPGEKDLMEVSWPKFEALAAANRTSAHLAAYFEGTFGLTERDRPQEIAGARVSGDFFAVWGVPPLLGRTFTAAEEKPGGAPVALLSYGFWRQRFGADPAILGRTLHIDGVATTVIGVMPDAYRFPFRAVQLWLPRPDVVTFLSERAVQIGAGYLEIVARLRPGATLGAAQADSDRIFAAYRADPQGHLDLNSPLGVAPLNEHLVGENRTTLLVLLGAVGLVLLIACADVANLLLAAGLARRRETAVRVALGAGRRQIFGLALGESLLIAVAGGVAGVLVAGWGLRLLVAANPADLPRVDDATLSLRTLAFAILITAVTGVLAGLAPAWQTLRIAPRSFLGEGGRGAAGGRRDSRWQGLLVSFQVALVLVLLSAAGLLLNSLQRVNGIELGFDPHHLLFVQVSLPAAHYPTPAARRVFFDGLVERVRAMPGVETAALVDAPPTVGSALSTFAVVGRPPVPPEKRPLVLRMMAGAGYFQTLRTRFVEGRDFDPHSAPDAPVTAIVSRSFRDLYFPGERVLGQHLLMRTSSVPIEIVGVVDDIQQQALEDGPRPAFFLFQPRVPPELSPPDAMHLALRTTLPPASIAAALRREVNALDPSEPLPELQTMQSLLRGATARRRLTTALFAAFSALALALCLLGIYGVVAHSVSQRRREIGVRVALGASHAQVLTGLLRPLGRWLLPGLAAGAAGTFVAGRLLASQLFGTGAAASWPEFAGAAALLAATALLASLVPAHKAAQVDPATTLRGE